MVLILNMTETDSRWWKAECEIHTPVGNFYVHLLRDGDENLLLKFTDMIGSESRVLFSPYHWGANSQVSEYRSAVAKTEKGEDASFVVLNSSNFPIAHLVLWGISRQYTYNNDILRIPTLGICVADQYQNKGIGKICMEFLQDVAKDLLADAIELTTVPQNERAIKLYLSCGFQDIGTLRIPLGVDPSTTDALALVRATWREECHMVYVINSNKEQHIKNYLLQKQILSDRTEKN